MGGCNSIMAFASNKCHVFWVTGLAGAGKTTVGKMLYQYLKDNGYPVVFLDGDEMREVLKNSDYSREGRKKLAFQYARLGQWLYKQGFNVVTCTVSMYDEVRAWNRENITDYKEIYLELPQEELIKRDKKGMYSAALTGKQDEVCGINLKIELPKNPDLVISNYGSVTPEIAMQRIINEFNL